LIFVTVGSQMPFGRLVRAVDEWASCNPEVEVIAQVGDDDTSQATHLHSFSSVPPDRYVELIRTCDLVVGHAGMGTVLTALEHAKPMLLMPRRHALQETRNDHQLATLRWLKITPGIQAVDDESALKAALDAWLLCGLPPPSVQGLHSGSTGRLITTLRDFIG